MLPTFKGIHLDIVKEKGAFAIGIVPIIAIDVFWPSLEKMLLEEPELWNRGQTLFSLRTHLLAGDLTLWLVLKEDKVLIAFLTMIESYVTGKSLQIVWGKGEQLQAYLAIALAGVEVFALRSNCTMVEIIGRDGWSKPLAKFGYNKLQTTFIKELSAERLN